MCIVDGIEFTLVCFRYHVPLAFYSGCEADHSPPSGAVFMLGGAQGQLYLCFWIELQQFSLRQKYHSLTSLYEFCSLACSVLGVRTSMFFHCWHFGLSVIEENLTKLNKSTLCNVFIKMRKVYSVDFFFQQKWTDEYLCVSMNGNAMCLICRGSIAIMK
jgi:hypothetical protein